MVQRIYSFIISSLLLFCFSGGLRAQNVGNDAAYINPNGQRQIRMKSEVKEEKKEDDAPKYPLYGGLSVGVDLWGLGNKLIGNDNLSVEVAVDADLLHTFFPTVELGYSDANSEGDLGILYKASAPYFRVGIDYNAFHKKKHGQQLLVGLRYGFTSYNYDIEGISQEDDIWGGSIGNPNLEDNIWGGSLPYSHPDMKGKMQWLEICLGLRAKIWKSLHMGWTVRYKLRLAEAKGQYGDPWYVPGFGKYDSNVLGVSYTIIYKLPY